MKTKQPEREEMILLKPGGQLKEQFEIMTQTWGWSITNDASHFNL